MKILITGSTGLLGQPLCRRLAEAAEVVGVSRHDPVGGFSGRHALCDLADAAQVKRLMEAHGPFDAVIHTQALSDVDRCEREPALALAQNAGTTRTLIDALPEPSWFFYISTDYVFDGKARAPYTEESPVNPISAYARSKAEGERAALSFARGIVLRPSTLFGTARSNFCDELVHALRSREPIPVFRDQTTSPTYTEDCAEAIGLLLEALAKQKEPPRHRIYHVSNQGACPRMRFAQRIADLLGCSNDVFRPVAMAETGRPAPRPAYSALTSTQLPQLIGRSMRPWEEALETYLRQRQWIS